MKCQILFSRKNNLHEVSNPFFLGKIICMKCQILFSRKNKKNISKCHLLIFLPTVLSVKHSKLQEKIKENKKKKKELFFSTQKY